MLSNSNAHKREVFGDEFRAKLRAGCLEELLVENGGDEAAITSNELEAALDRKLSHFLKRCAIFYTNCANMRPGHGAGIFLTTSRLNHSCQPNVDCWYNPTLGKQNMHANRARSAGEELLATYIAEIARRPRSERMKALKESWGFNCSCTLCATPEGSESERTRGRLFELWQQLERWERDEAPSSAVQVPITNQQAFAVAEEMAGLMEDDGIMDYQLAVV